MEHTRPNALGEGIVPYEPWAAAKRRFVQGLPKHERELFEHATVENIYYAASVAQRSHEENSRVRATIRRLRPLTDALEDFGKAMDVLSNSACLYMCPVWGSIRVVLSIVKTFEDELKRLVEILEQIGSLLPRMRDYETLFATDASLMISVSNAYLVVLDFCCDIKDVFMTVSRHTGKVAS